MMPPIGGRDEVRRGSLRLILWFIFQACDNPILDHLEIAIVIASIFPVYGARNEVYSLDERA
jgi:hypothetical protein